MHSLFGKRDADNPPPVRLTEKAKSAIFGESSPVGAFATLDQMHHNQERSSRHTELISLCAEPSTRERAIREVLDECSAADLRRTDEDGFTALCRCAASRDGRRLVEQFLARGADPNAVSPLGSTALILASMRDYRETARALCEAGADTRHRMSGKTAAGWARQSGHTELAGILDAIPRELGRKCGCESCNHASICGH